MLKLMGFRDAVKRAAQNGGRKTTVGGICASEYGLSKEDMKHIASKGMNTEKGAKKK
jgi:hypothetical protein